MSNNRWTTADIGDQSGRVAVVTGANSGLGLETARALAHRGATVVLAVRNVGKGQAAADDITAGGPGAKVGLQELDLASLASVRTAADELRAKFDRIDLLIDRLLPVAGSRIVSVSSVAHRVWSRINFNDLQAEKGYNRVAAYGRSKLANLLFTYELQRRLGQAGAGTKALAAHPGVSNTELGRHLPPGPRQFAEMARPMDQSAASGALPTLRAATDPAATGGQYYGPGGFMELEGRPVLVRSSARSHEAETQKKLWAASEQLTGVTFPFGA